MKVPIFQVDSFSKQPFAGNPAGVCPLEAPRDEAWMQNVAAEMNLSETAFLVPQEDGYDLRWFTPAVEVDLCGHATLASAHVLWETGRLPQDQQARFHTRSGLLTADRVGGQIELNFPANAPAVLDAPPGLLDTLGVEANWVGASSFDYLVEVASESVLRQTSPDFGRLKALPVRGVIVTAAAQDGPFDFVSRFFAPGSGIDEDPVTGSAHCTLAPYWASKLGKNEMLGFQASRRGGEVRVKVDGDRVCLRGDAVTVLSGELRG